METYLAHHGILGMKWGVRRYQNYDGSYTRAGMERYNKAKDAYDRATARREAVKKNPDAGSYQLHDAKVRQHQAKKEMSKAYDRLKNDKLADEGRLLYADGHRVRANNAKVKYMYGTGMQLGTAAVAAYMWTGESAVTKIFAGSALASVSAASILRRVNEHDNKRLRAYYGHVGSSIK